eukprot:NODE_96_length_20709_cov_1.429161.p17 type:complete len:115 gc:universal NODE_96_length_20709_cov_1.429161:19247-19591(+)
MLYRCEFSSNPLRIVTDLIYLPIKKVLEISSDLKRYSEGSQWMIACILYSPFLTLGIVKGTTTSPNPIYGYCSECFACFIYNFKAFLTSNCDLPSPCKYIVSLFNPQKESIPFT